MSWGTICHLVRNCLETDGGSFCSILAVDIWKKTKSAMIRRSMASNLCCRADVRKDLHHTQNAVGTTRVIYPFKVPETYARRVNSPVPVPVC